MKDYYEILGVSREATDAELKKAFRQLAMKYHPDRNPGDKAAEDTFKEINEAYSCLSDPAKRSNYDRFGTADGAGAGFGNFGGFGDVFENIFEDFFGAFGGGRQRVRPTRGSDLRYDQTITLTEAVFGVEKEIKFPKWEDCGECKGSGAKPGTSPEVCPTCKGSGQMRYQQGIFSVSKPCGKCGGAGRIIAEPCGNCKGRGKVETMKSIGIKIPGGVDSGSRLKIYGEGGPGAYGGPSGDLYVIINVEEHHFFKRDGTEIFCEVPVSFPQAALGAEIEVPTLDGPAKLKVPAGTSSGSLFTLKGHGASRIGGSHRGNQTVRVSVAVPKKLTTRQRELLEEFASINGDDVTKSFRERLKDLFTGTEK